MGTRTTGRTGILIVRMWLEADPQADPAEGFRARITQTHDARDPAQITSIAGRPDDLYAAVATWVEAFRHASPKPPDDAT